MERTVLDLGKRLFKESLGPWEKIILRRGPSWRRKDPSQKIRLGPGNKVILRRGAHRAGGGKNCLGPGEKIILRRGAHRAGAEKISLGPGNKVIQRRGAHRSGGGKNCLGPWEKILEAKRSVSEDPSRTWEYSYSKERRSPGWRWKEPSRTWE